MPVIRMDVLAELYAEYSFSIYEQKKDAILEEGIENVLLRLQRYSRNPDKFALKSQQALKEIEAVLERFYYQDRKFSKMVHEKALTYVRKHTALLQQTGN
jgi:hypothetical protein